MCASTELLPVLRTVVVIRNTLKLLSLNCPRFLLKDDGACGLVSIKAMASQNKIIIIMTIIKIHELDFARERVGEEESF